MSSLVAVLGGGPSPERDISLATARAVAEHLPRAGFAVLSVEILSDTRWRVEAGEAGPADTALAEFRRRGVAVVFPGLHGRWGEDGTVQGFLEVAGLPCVGSGVAASALAMDKARTREVVAAQGLPVAAALEFRGDVAAARSRAMAKIGLPAVVKDPTGGSSLGVRVVRGPGELEEALAALLDPPGGRALVEEYVAGRELSVAVLGNASVGGALEALPPILIRPLESGWFDYETKYDPGKVEELCPAPVERELSVRVAECALVAHRVLGCDGLTRTDFLVPDDGVPRFLELNTLPGLTAASLCPKAARAAGMEFHELLGRLVGLALEKKER